MDVASSSAAPPVGIPAPYGRACSNCSRAKCRCIYRQDGNGCERCYRLKKDCRPSTPVRRRASGKKSSSAMLSRTAQLEQKLDGLVSLLTAQTNSHLKDKETVREGSAATTGTDTATDTTHSYGSDSAPETSARGTPAASSGHGDYSVESRTLSAVTSDFRPVLPNGPEFGCGMMPQAIPPLTARIATSLPRRGDVSATENGYPALGLGMSGMPRTPESSTSSNVPAPGGSQSHSKRQQEQSQQNPQSTENPQNTQNTQNTQNPQGHQSQSSANAGWGFSYFPNTPRAPRAIPFENSGQSTPKDPLNLDPDITPTIEEAEHSFQVFRSTMLPYFPFVHLPPDLTAQQLRATRPYFWLAIMSMTYQRLPGHVQQARSTHLRALFAQRIVLESEKSLDLLQSLLTFLAWIHYTSRRDRPTLSVITQLAISLVYDLGLHKYMAPCKSLIARLVRDHYQQSYGPGLATSSTSGAGTDDAFPEPQTSSLDERRAALSCYVLTSNFSLALKRCDTLKWTSRMEEHLAEVSSKAESPLDHVLVLQVRMQRVADFVSQGDWQNSDPNITSALSLDCMAIGNGYMPGANEDNSRRLMPSFVAHMVRAKIEEIKDSIPPDVRQHDAVLDAIYAGEMIVSAAVVMPVIAPVLSMATITVVAIRSLNKRARSRSGGNASQAESPYQGQNQRPAHTTQTSSTLASDFAHIAALERCVEAVAAFWAFFQHVTSGSFSSLPFSYFAHFTLCIVLLYGLSIIDEPNWDRAAVRDRLQVLSMLDGFIAKLGEAPRIVPSAGQDSYDVFSRAATMLSSVRELWAADIDNEGSGERAGERARAWTRKTTGERVPPTSAPRPANNAAAPQPTAATMTSAPMAAPPSRSAQQTVPPEMNMAIPTDAPAWQMPPMPASGPGIVSMPTMDTGDTAMGDAPPATPQDPSMLLGPDMAVPDLFSVMGLSEDYMFWDLFLPGEDGSLQI
ncbi:hypothetical protein F503_03550 [Ophiostoma piceae UAMH 11346]|uniref:Zn(2)-C6 fungal-type domain-containing protein n=1 Tax=Ophiostoma piceae (strain UAMH 11346) TaxID=1262450 RepID=S3CDT2_OPHP1|nr:hypothetical protein F503_03550 [Ophiostoma piceae UAMH 11346]